MTVHSAQDLMDTDPLELPRYACPACGTTAGLATIELAVMYMPLAGVTRCSDGEPRLHEHPDDMTVIDWDSTQTVGVSCRRTGCGFFYRGPNWAGKLVYPIPPGPHPADDGLELDD